ncbi:actin, cytoplasmic-like [Sarcophilus harrisii]
MNMECQSEEISKSNKPLIGFDLIYFRVGYGGERAPRFVFPCVVGRYKKQNVMHGLDEKDTFIGDEVTDNWRKLTVKYPVEQGIVTNWEDMEKIWHHAFYNVLRVDPEQHPLLVTESITNPKANKEKLVEIMFETFGVPALYVAIQDILSLFSSGRTTGFVVNSGDEATYHVAINGGYIMSGTIMNLEVSGQDLSTYLMKLLSDKGYSLKTRAEWEMVRDIKEKLCYVALDYREEMDTEESSIQKKYKLPDGRDITVGKERFLCPEALFEPSVLGGSPEIEHYSPKSSTSPKDQTRSNTSPHIPQRLSTSPTLPRDQAIPHTPRDRAHPHTYTPEV